MVVVVVGGRRVPVGDDAVLVVEVIGAGVMVVPLTGATQYDAFAHRFEQFASI